jgi:hypothetical protein
LDILLPDKAFYLHTLLPDLVNMNVDLTVSINDSNKRSNIDLLNIAVCVLEIADRIGIHRPNKAVGSSEIPYSDGNDRLTFSARLTSFLTGKDIRFLRGWKQYSSCVKGFSALGLMAEQVLYEVRRLEGLDAEVLLEEKRAFLRTRQNEPKDGREGSLVFEKGEVDAMDDSVVDETVAMLDLSLWLAFATREIFCSTSSNMGISLHETLRYVQGAKATAAGKTFSVLNADEGYLVIWCPDEGADFMNSEKSETLRKLESEEPKLTRLHTYINRKQRDPGALRDALISGGYFFPTNPQSEDELQNLLTIALENLSRERSVGIAEVLKDENVQRALFRMKCEIKHDRVIVNGGVESGLYGMTLAYYIMLEETLTSETPKAISSWNQASIGAALAAAVLGDKLLDEFDEAPQEDFDLFQTMFPKISQLVADGGFKKHLQRRIHGIFDIANLQSLAQLLGVVVERHLSGRGTAYVGLGSSSYANGNLCYDILKDSNESGAAFRGRDFFHPSTHTLNPVAQALIFADDFLRVVTDREFAGISDEQKVLRVLAHTRKPEPAGAAGMAGYLLARLDSQTLSVLEIAYCLRLVGFDSKLFLELAKLGSGSEGMNWYLQEANEEGDYMAQFAQNLLLFLDWPLGELAEKSLSERIHSRLNYNLSPLDDDDFEALDPVTFIYLTGDNTQQPDEGFAVRMIEAWNNCAGNIENALCIDEKTKHAVSESRKIISLKSSYSLLIRGLQSIEGMINNAMKRRVSSRVNRIIRNHLDS